MTPSAITTECPRNSVAYEANGSATTPSSPNAASADCQQLPNFNGYDHVTWWVGNAKQAASYYETLFGMTPQAYSGLETGSRFFASHVVANGDVRFVFTSPLRSLRHLPADEAISADERALLAEMHAHLERHGDAVKDVAFAVDSVAGVYARAVANGAAAVQAPRVTADPPFGAVTTAVLRTYGDTTHTLVSRDSYTGPFLPGYRAAAPAPAPAPAPALPAVPMARIDHCVGNQDWGALRAACAFYERCLAFRRFWSVDDGQIATAASALRSVVMASAGAARVKMPINEPARAARPSQVEEFVRFNAGAGVQHLALQTPDMLAAVAALRARGVRFINVPPAYYAALRRRLGGGGGGGGEARRRWRLREDLDALERLHILVDYDEGGYLLQLFTKPLMDRPTVFIEIIQRHDFDGFGAGNFKSLFEAIERDQAERGNL